MKMSILLIAFLMSGCAQLEVIKDKGAQVNDGVLDNAVWTTCYASSIGSIRRRFGVSPDSAAAYEMFCEEEWSTETVKIPIQ